MYHHQEQREQQEAGWEGGPMKVRGAEMQYDQQHAQFQQHHHHYYQYQEQQQQPSEYVRGSEEDW
jgi:hypothetical protein